MTIHQLAGLPRSGSTLLGNILAQHPDLTVTGTSPLADLVMGMKNCLSTHPEIISQLERREGAYDRYISSIKAFMEEWHSDSDTEHVLDKSRAWPAVFELSKQIDPDTVTICCVRDPRDIVASIEKQDDKTAAFNSPVAPDFYNRASKMMSPEGLVGSPIKLVEDAIRRKRKIYWVRFESFMASPEPVLADLTSALGLHEFEYCLVDIENASPDMDAIYRNKYPHVGSGKLSAPEGHWSDVMGDEMANNITGTCELLMRTFSY